MQTNLRGRDLISDLDFSKEEVETVLDVAFDLSGNVPSVNRTPTCATKSWDCCFSLPAPGRAAVLKRVWLN